MQKICYKNSFVSKLFSKALTLVRYTVIYLILSLFLSFSALLDALTKNGSSAGNGAFRRRTADGSESTGAQPERDGQESGGGDLKAFTKEQVEGVQR